MKNLIYLIFPFLVLTLSSNCKLRGNDITEIGVFHKLTPHKYTTQVIIGIDGNFSCEAHALFGGQIRDKMYKDLILIGKVDTVLKFDWYSEDMYVKLEPEECVQKLNSFTVDFYY